LGARIQGKMKDWRPRTRISVMEWKRTLRLEWWKMVTTGLHE